MNIEYRILRGLSFREFEETLNQFSTLYPIDVSNVIIQDEVVTFALLRIYNDEDEDDWGL